MDTIYILNIPNFYTTYYLFGFKKGFKVKFKMETAFLKYNNKPLLIFKIKNKIAVIDNDDPVNVVQELYDLADAYFVTNKLLDNKSYQQAKVKALFPHYPINILPLYFTLFNVGLFRFLKFKALAKEIYIQLKRPIYKDYPLKTGKENFIFFSSNIWKKEPKTNTIRAEFIRFCKADDRIKFKGGFVPRSDGNNYGFDNELNHIKYAPKEFSNLSSQSKIVLNNPAVCGAVSWRLAEYLNQSLFILSFPFKIELPVSLKHDQNICYVEETTQFKEVFDKVLENEVYHRQIASNAKDYFLKYCTPHAQVNYIINTLFK
jgi:hypothetical protein